MEDEQGHRKKKVKTLRRPLRDYERSKDPADENRDEETTDDRTPEGEERLTGNPFAADDTQANAPEGGDEGRES